MKRQEKLREVINKLRNKLLEIIQVRFNKAEEGTVNLKI